MQQTLVQSVVIGNRLVEKGDTVKVVRGGTDPTAFKAWFVDSDGEQVATVYGGRGFNPALPLHEQKGVAQFRTIPLARVQPLNQNAGGRPKYRNPHKKRVKS